MLQVKRHQDILRLLQLHKSMTVKELCTALYVSPATMRRDLTELEEAGLLTRSFGGAALNELFPDQQPFSVRQVEHTAEKKRAAAKAAALIRPGQTLFLDASTTTFWLIPHLDGIPDLTVITNSPHACLALAKCGVRCFCTGGELLQGSRALVGSDAEHYIRGLRAHLCFFSARGIADGEISDSSKAERDLKIAMIERADRRVFLYDSSKAGNHYPFVIARAEELDAVICE